MASTHDDGIEARSETLVDLLLPRVASAGDDGHPLSCSAIARLDLAQPLDRDEAVHDGHPMDVSLERARRAHSMSMSTASKW